MYATRYRTNRRTRSARGPVNTSRNGGIQGLVLVRDTSRAGVWVLKPTKPQAAVIEAQPVDEGKSEA
ncbi:hypothetical protein UK23_07270 [Lentzea aerocolonigenes]|jgi:hypothetical protein|uniref:Uncharacterized protein n=2 Tax=Lentzea TaxID=165301 RepID=A0A0F0HCB7_LENAE|nr:MULTISPECIES: hypothetical protein [Lentzea]KJK51293.1 hypothetical protein UK23_07270 [Lentzea aerocolonigenes]MDT7783962.1 hypothetical protein [Pseudonocardiales bacterium]NGY57735.1 hypothetical protein [Lentzea alba]